MTATHFALAGCPNCGKSALFNALTGARQQVGNYPGVTVEKKLGTLKLSSGELVTIVDLPGIYSFVPHAPDEQIAVNVLLDKQAGSIALENVVVVTDATNLERTLGLALEVRRLGKLAAVVVNMMDLAKSRGLRLNIAKLSEELGVPVVSTIATRHDGVRSLTGLLERIVRSPSPGPKDPSRDHWKTPTAKDLLARQDEIQKILGNCVEAPTQAHLWSQRLDKVILHKIWGGPILAAVLFLMFQAVFSWAETPMELVEEGIYQVGELARTAIPHGLLESLVVDGMIAGVGSVLVFLPQILILFFFIFLLEGSGYMMRAAFIMDNLMARVGLQGKAFVPLLSSFACAIPGVMATRTIKSQRDRFITMMIAPLMTCSARLPVYVLLIGAFIPNRALIGPIKLQGFVMFALFLIGVLSAMVVAYVSQKWLPQTQRTPVIFDLPSYRWPSWKHIGWQLWQRAALFLKKAGKVIMSVSVVIWLLASFPRAPSDWQGPAITYSAAGRIGQTIEPLLAPLGFDWRICTGLIPGFAAREVMVGALGTVFAVEDAEETRHGMQSLQARIAATWSLSTGLSLLAWYIFAPQCLATFAVLRRESNSWRYTGGVFLYLLALAYLASWLTFNVASLFS